MHNCRKNCLNKSIDHNRVKLFLIKAFIKIKFIIFNSYQNGDIRCAKSILATIKNTAREIFLGLSNLCLSMWSIKELQRSLFIVVQYLKHYRMKILLSLFAIQGFKQNSSCSYKSSLFHGTVICPEPQVNLDATQNEAKNKKPVFRSYSVLILWKQKREAQKPRRQHTNLVFMLFS